MLKGATLGSIDLSSPAAFPKLIDERDLTYTRLDDDPSSPLSSPRTPIGRATAYDSWLARGTGAADFSVQPYDALATVLRARGDAADADRVLFDGAEAEEAHSRWLARVRLFISHWTIGFGYKYWYALIWTVVFVVIGRVVLLFTRRTLQQPGRIGWIYSLSTFVPVLQIGPKWFEDVRLEGFADVYFNIHRLLGYFFAAAVVAGVTGFLAQPK